MSNIKNPLDDYQLIELEDKSFLFANVDSFGIEGTPTLENTAKPYVVNEETGQPGVITGEPLNSVPRDNNDESVLYNTSDVYFHPEYTYEETKEEPTVSDNNENPSTTPTTEP